MMIDIYESLENAEWMIQSEGFILNRIGWQFVEKIGDVDIYNSIEGKPVMLFVKQCGDLYKYYTYIEGLDGDVWVKSVFFLGAHYCHIKNAEHILLDLNPKANA